MTLAPLSRRVLAGLIDGVALVLLSVLAFLVPMKLLGVVLPMWGVLAVMLGWSVVPLAFLQQTAGMRLMGLELAREDGHPVDLANVTFRELLGRGLFPAAYLLTLLFGVLAQVFGVMAFVVPTGLGLVMTFACLMAFVGALAGGLLGLTRADGRGLADLMTKSFVVVAPARKPPDDADDLAEQKAHRRTVVNRIVVFELVLALGVVATPWLLTRRGGESSAHRTERIKRQGLEKKFAASPADESLARELMESLERDGQADEAKRVLERYQRAAQAREGEREKLLRENFAKSPDERTAGLLIELLDDQGRLDEAITVYRAWLGSTPTPSRRAGFGHWLGVRGRENQAVAELQQALGEDPLVPMGHTMLGIVLLRLERFDEARTELFYALELDPEDEDARDSWDEALATTGPLSKAQEQALRLTVKRWSVDAGSR
ncbi:MAG: tetratricopeptide repeat protein [Archangiaceae bacterium]|nr:tetratricopeptide repeat protein [Archangiaceae bacterium]